MNNRTSKNIHSITQDPSTSKIGLSTPNGEESTQKPKIKNIENPNS